MMIILALIPVAAIVFYLFLSNLEIKENSITHKLDAVINAFGLNKYKLNGKTVFTILIVLLAAIVLKMLFAHFYMGILVLGVAIYALNYVLNVVIENKTKKIDKIYLNFLNVYTNFFNTYNNCPDALRETGKYVGEPLKSIIKRNMLLYDTSSKTFLETLDAINNSVLNAEFRKFVSFTKIYEKYGGNYNEILTHLREQALKNMQIRTERESNATTATFVIGGTIALSLLSLIGLNQMDIDVLTHTIQGWAVIGFNIFAYIVGIYVIKNIAQS